MVALYQAARYVPWTVVNPMPAPACSSKSILVVDDEPLVCDAVKMMLSFDGHKVQTAASGQEALALLENGSFDLVITDFEMPHMKGDELAAAIKARSPKQPVVMITAYAEMLEAAGNPLKGVDCLISKPFLLVNLREAVAKATSPDAQMRAAAESPAHGDKPATGLG
jgi:two-component system, NtrC family, response regulator AtoC